MRLERWSAGAAPGSWSSPGGVEIFVVEGSLQDDEGRYAAGAWLRLPDGAALEARSPGGCVLYVKTGAVSTLLRE